MTFGNLFLIIRRRIFRHSRLGTFFSRQQISTKPCAKDPDLEKRFGKTKCLGSLRRTRNCTRAYTRRPSSHAANWRRVKLANGPHSQKGYYYSSFTLTFFILENERQKREREREKISFRGNCPLPRASRELAAALREETTSSPRDAAKHTHV